MLALMLLVALQAAPPPKVILVTVRGAAARQVDAYRREGLLPADGGFARLHSRGLRVRELVPDPGAVTATAAATLATGATPARHGITGNTLHRLGDPAGQAASGFAIPLGAETLREAAARQGKRVVDILPVLASGSRSDTAGSVLTGGQASSGPVNAGSPASFVSGITAAAGVWPGYPDHEGFVAGRVPPPRFLADVERLRAFKVAAALHVIRSGAYDLLIVDDPTVDAVMHAFPSPASAEARAAYRMADRTLRVLMDAAGPDVAIAAASGHDIHAVKHGVSVGSLLRGTEARIFAYGPVAHIRTSQPSAVMRILRAARDPDGAAIFDRVSPRSDADHPAHSGDVVALARPGYFLHSAAIPDPRPRFPGDHGFRADRGAFYAAGPGIRPRVIGKARLVDVAPTVSALLGIQPPARSEGRNLLQ
ncbi:MAG: alkaline phosphatase family protein [Bryobacteraceae bacterium]|nr:alkaline phosphatase family protein [Bryobacteraceae bacterium]